MTRDHALLVLSLNSLWLLGMYVFNLRMLPLEAIKYWMRRRMRARWSDRDEAAINGLAKQAIVSYSAAELAEASELQARLVFLRTVDLNVDLKELALSSITVGTQLLTLGEDGSRNKTVDVSKQGVDVEQVRALSVWLQSTVAGAAVASLRCGNNPGMVGKLDQGQGEGRRRKVVGADDMQYPCGLRHSGVWWIAVRTLSQTLLLSVSVSKNRKTRRECHYVPLGSISTSALACTDV